MEEDEHTAVTEEDEAAIQADEVLVEADAAAAAVEEMAEPAEDLSSKPSRLRMAERATYAATATICREIVRSTMIVETMLSGWMMINRPTRHPGRRKSGRNVPTL